MADHIINITNGSGSKRIDNGTYSVSSNINGYNNSSISPVTVRVTADAEIYSFTVAATGKLTFHVTENGQTGGVPVVGATFYRCDADGNQYGDAVVSDANGDAIFNYVPFSADATVASYFKQIASDGEHSFDSTVKAFNLTNDTTVEQVENAPFTTKTFKITDANYDNLPVGTGTLTLTD